MSRRLLIAVMLAFIAIATTIALGLMSFGLALAADPVSVKLTPRVDGDVNVIDVAIESTSTSSFSVDIKATLPAGATFVSASPTAKVTGSLVSWNIGSLSPNKTTVGYQYKFKGGGTTTVSAVYIGATRGTTAASATAGAEAPTAALTSAAATKAPKAELMIKPIPANASAANVITATLPGGTSVVAMGTTGLPNASVGVPVVLNGASSEAQGPAQTYAWTLTTPTTSKAKLDKTDAQLVKFTPDVPGVYKVDLVVGNEVGKSGTESVQIRAGKYIGVDNGGCATCHAETQEWAKTNHATIMTREIDGGAEPATSHYGEGCLRCHTTGYYVGVSNGGFAETQAKTGWKFPQLASIQTGKGNWTAVPAALKNMGNIQCEACHGPAQEHVTAQAPMAASLDEGVCNVCHNAGGSHSKGAMFANSKHSEGDSQAWTYPTGPARQDCVRCHSGEGYISFTKNPTEKSTWSNTASPATCAVCHDPHSEANTYQLRISGVPVEANGITKDFGLSATCVECHNGRVPPEAAARASFPHYSAAGEILSNTGGVEYGQKIVDSPHSLIVGAAPIKDPSDATGKATLFGGNAPGSCVACHMWPTIKDNKDPNYNKVGNHSFNAVSPDGTYDYMAPCQTCHPGTKTLADFKSRSDYDGNGKNDSVQAEVAGLLTALQKAIGDSGIKPVSGHPYFDQANKAGWTEKQKNAIYNYLFVRGLEGSDGKAAAIHNYKRSVNLLQLSYKDLTGKEVPNATILK